MSETSLGEMIFGINAAPEIRALDYKQEWTQEEARKILKAIVHPEIRTVVDDIEKMITTGAETVVWRLSEHANIKDQYIAWSVCEEKGHDPLKDVMLFSSFALRSNLPFYIATLIEKAFPEYRKAERMKLLEIELKKV